VNVVALPSGCQPLSSRSFTVVSPEAASSVGNQSRPENICRETSPALILPGQRTRHGTRKAPSQFEFFSLRNGVVAASGQENWFGPLSVVKTTMERLPKNSSNPCIVGRYSFLSPR
jgi:hypothetical protein